MPIQFGAIAAQAILPIVMQQFLQKGGAGAAAGGAQSSIMDAFLQGGARTAGSSLANRVFNRPQVSQSGGGMTPAGEFPRIGPENVRQLQTGRSGGGGQSLLNNPILLSMLMR